MIHTLGFHRNPWPQFQTPVSILFFYPYDDKLKILDESCKKRQSVFSMRISRVMSYWYSQRYLNMENLILNIRRPNLSIGSKKIQMTLLAIYFHISIWTILKPCLYWIIRPTSMPILQYGVNRYSYYDLRPTSKSILQNRVNI